MSYLLEPGSIDDEGDEGMTKIIEDAIEVIKQHGVYCPFKMAVPCKRNKSRSACSFDGKCCSWTKIDFPKEWLRCKKYVEFVELIMK